VLEVIEFYAGPNPFDGECTFGYIGTGTASVMSVEVYDLAGTMVWAGELTDVTEIVWNGTDESGSALANGAYIYKIYATDGTNTFSDMGKVFVNR
jgi:flagellar hook assembly protein FlgD